MSEVLRQYVLDKKHHVFRKSYPQYAHINEEFQQLALSPKERMTRRFELFSSLEEPIFLPEERICFVRTTKDIPDCFTKEEWEDLKQSHFIHELGYMSNISPNYERAIRCGLLKLKEDADEYGKRMIDAIIRLSDRYCEAAKQQGNTELAEALSNVPRYGARNFLKRSNSSESCISACGWREITTLLWVVLTCICTPILQQIWKRACIPKRQPLSFWRISSSPLIKTVICTPVYSRATMVRAWSWAALMQMERMFSTCSLFSA